MMRGLFSSSKFVTGLPVADPKIANPTDPTPPRTKNLRLEIAADDIVIVLRESSYLI